MPKVLDDYLLELILMDTIAVAGGRCAPGVERTIQRFLPDGLYDQIVERYDAISWDADDEDPHLLTPWLRKAAGKNSRWKRRMIVQFLNILRTGGPLGPAEWAEVAALAAAMGAGRECRQVFSYRLTMSRPSNSSRLHARDTGRNVAAQHAQHPAGSSASARDSEANCNFFDKAR